MAPSNTAPGTVVIILAGAHAGQRAIVLKSMSDNRLALYSPTCSVIALPRRHCLGTSMKLDVAGVKSFEDELFKKTEATKLEAIAAEIHSKLSGVIKKDVLIDEYFSTPFSLNNCLGVPPHQLKF